MEGQLKDSIEETLPKQQVTLLARPMLWEQRMRNNMTDSCAQRKKTQDARSSRRTARRWLAYGGCSKWQGRAHVHAMFLMQRDQTEMARLSDDKYKEPSFRKGVLNLAHCIQLLSTLPDRPGTAAHSRRCSASCFTASSCTDTGSTHPIMSERRHIVAHYIRKSRTESVKNEGVKRCNKLTLLVTGPFFAFGFITWTILAWDN